MAVTITDGVESDIIPELLRIRKNELRTLSNDHERDVGNMSRHSPSCEGDLANCMDSRALALDFDCQNSKEENLDCSSRCIPGIQAVLAFAKEY